MSANTQPIFPAAPVVGIASMTTPTAVTSRARITGTTGLTQLTAASTNGTRVDEIKVVSKGNSVAGALDMWIYDGTNSHYFDSIDLTANTASTTNDPFKLSKLFTTLALPPAYQLFVSVTVQQDVTVFALGGAY